MCHVDDSVAGRERKLEGGRRGKRLDRGRGREGGREGGGI